MAVLTVDSCDELCLLAAGAFVPLIQHFANRKDPVDMTERYGVTCSPLEQGLASLHPCIRLGALDLCSSSGISLDLQQSLCGAGIAGVVQHWLRQGALHGICDAFRVTAYKTVCGSDHNSKGDLINYSRQER